MISVPIDQILALLPFVLAALMYRELMRLRRRVEEMEESIMSIIFRSSISNMDIKIVDLGDRDNEA